MCCAALGIKNEPDAAALAGPSPRKKEQPENEQRVEDQSDAKGDFPQRGRIANGQRRDPRCCQRPRSTALERQHHLLGGFESLAWVTRNGLEHDMIEPDRNIGPATRGCPRIASIA